MSWSLALQHGDFVVSASHLSTVTDEQKLVQDLRCAVLEPMGTDDMHPSFGSLIDGGRGPDGTVNPGAIGLGFQQASSFVQGEIERIARNYQNQQLNRAKNDRLTYNRVSLTPGEALLSIANLKLVQQADKLFVTVALQTARGQAITAVFPVGSGAG